MKISEESVFYWSVAGGVHILCKEEELKLQLLWKHFLSDCEIPMQAVSDYFYLRVKASWLLSYS